MSLPTYATGLSTSYGIGNILYANSLFLAQGQNAQGNIATSSDGITWTLRAMPSSATWSIASNGTNMFVATSASSTATARSTNGTVWTPGTALPTAFGTASKNVAFLGNRCLVVISSTYVYYSDDNAATWSAAQTLPFNPAYWLMKIGSNFWMADSGYSSGYTSPTGATGSWTARALPVVASVNVLVWKDTDGSILCMSGSPTDKKIYRTVDGIAWDDTGIPAPAIYTHTPITIGGVKAYFSSTYPSSKTCHNGVWVPRVANISTTVTSVGINPSGIMCIPSNGGGFIIRYDPTSMEPSATFEG